MLKQFIFPLICFSILCNAANAGTLTFSGYLNDNANSALVGSDLGPALFSDDYDIANNVALYSFNVPIAGNVIFDSNGFAVGGADPYFTLFAGSGNSATVAGSNYDQAFSTGGDFFLTYALAAGDYQVAMGVFANMSLAENVGTGTLGDGFSGLGGPGFLGNSYYELGITTPDQPGPPVPEPGTLFLLGCGLFGMFEFRKKFQK